MECKTYELILTNSKSAIDNIEMDSVIDALKEFSKEDYFIRIHETPLNKTAHYSTGIIVLKKSLEEAEIISDKIQKILENMHIRTQRFETKLLWHEPNSRFYMELSHD